MTKHPPAVPLAPRALPLIHVALAGIALLALFLPMVSLGDGSAPTVHAIAGPWALVSAALIGLFGLAAALLSISGRTQWPSLVVVDVGILLGLAPAVVGVLLRWSVPAGGIDSFGPAFWLIFLLMIARIPFSIHVRGMGRRAAASKPD
jgi:uncharacterized membrane protein